MKTLELSLNKRLLIVEITAVELAASMLIGDLFPEYELELICKGSDLTEEIVKEFIPIDEKEARIKYPKAFLISYKRFQNAFIDVIEANGWHWGENPYGKPNPIYVGSAKVYHKTNYVKWQESESRTFNPEKCLIFEIV